MRRSHTRAVLAAVLFSLATLPAAADTKPASFEQWLAGFRDQARAAGISEYTIAAALDGVRPLPRVLALDRQQPEFVQSFWQYIEARVTPGRVERGRQMLARHGPLLAEMERRFGVQPRVLVALWGMESDFGGDTGDVPLASALATLAHDTRRSAFFSDQLLAFLQIIEYGDVSAAARGSWAGAMGQVQFMPVTYRDFAVDGDSDGRRDLWRSLPDIMASAANYLTQSGWRAGETWGREVLLPAEFDLAAHGAEVRRPLSAWRALGVLRADGADLPNVDMEASLLLPAGLHRGPAFLVYRNFDVIMTWNRSLLYALAVGHLADRIAGDGPLRAPRPAFEDALTRSDLFEVQVMLTRLGYDTGQPDGVLGAKTRSALQSFQRARALPPDGYPSAGVIERLRFEATP